jgi:RNA polymerase sigma-70 factor (ECF subfamily)
MQVLADDRIAIDKPNLDKEFVRRCQKGDRHAFRQLYQNYQARVRATLYQLCGSEGLDDLVQEVFLKVWKSLPKLREAGYFSTWLYRIAWNVALDRRKKLKQKQTISLGDRDFYDLEIPNSVVNNGDLISIHYRDLVERGLKTLSMEHRAVLILHDLEDIPQKEIAEILDIPIGTVKSRLHNARNYIKKFLQQQGISL